MQHNLKLCQFRNVGLFQIPPGVSSKGYYLNSWKDKIWQGNLRVSSRDGMALVEFINLDDTVFAECIVDPENPDSSVQKTVDSTRGWGVKLASPDGRFAWVGLIFKERNHSVDFNDSFQKFRHLKQLEANPDKYADEFVPQKDFSVKAGQQINITFGGSSAKPSEPFGAPSRPAPSGSGFTLAPPPKAGSTAPSGSGFGGGGWGFGSSTQASAGGSGGGDLFGNFSGFKASPQPQPAPLKPMGSALGGSYTAQVQGKGAPGAPLPQAPANYGAPANDDLDFLSGPSPLGPANSYGHSVPSNQSAPNNDINLLDLI